MKRLPALIVLILIVAAVRYYAMLPGPAELVLTGIVTTDNVIVSPQMGGRINSLLVNEGDTVKADQLIALIEPRELEADRAYYDHSVAGLAAQVQESQSALRYQERQTEDQIQQAEAALASMNAQKSEADVALENAKINLQRTEALMQQGLASAQQFDQARTSYDAAKAHVNVLSEQVQVQKTAVALARTTQEQIGVKQGQLASTQHQQAAAAAQRTKANVRLSYSEVRSPVSGIVDIRAARPGEVVNVAQPVITIINPDDLWVRADVEETYIDRMRIGDKFRVRLPSGEERDGTIFYRAADAGFATQRDVSRTKRDIKTFEVRLRVDNADRRLAVGMTAYVLLPIR